MKQEELMFNIENGDYDECPAGELHEQHRTHPIAASVGEQISGQVADLDVETMHADPMLVAWRTLQGMDETTVTLLRKLGLVTDREIHPFVGELIGAVVTSADEKGTSIGISLFLKDKGRIMVTDRAISSESGKRSEIDAMLLMAKIKGWNSIRIHGPSDFQLEVYMAATAQGIPIKGFRPTKQQEELIRLHGETLAVRSKPAEVRTTVEPPTVAEPSEPEITL